MLPVNFTAQGRPARFGQVQSALAFNLGHTVNGPTDGSTYVVQGIDVSAGPTAGEAAAYYDIDGAAQVYFWSDTIDLSAPKIAYPGSWRGAMALGNGDTLAIHIEVIIPAGLAIAAWGLLVPYPFGGAF